MKENQLAFPIIRYSKTTESTSAQQLDRHYVENPEFKRNRAKEVISLQVIVHCPDESCS